MPDPGARVRTLAEALGPLGQELAAGRQAINTFAARIGNAKVRVPPTLAGEVHRLADAINAGAAKLDRTNALLAQVAGGGGGGGGFGLLQSVSAFARVQGEIDGLVAPIAQITNEMRAVRQTIERALAAST